MGKVIAVANQKGGVGKTTTCIEIAAALTDLGQKVLLIDLDQQGNLSKYVGADETKPTIYQLLHAEDTVENGIQSFKYYDVITASGELSKADKEFVDTEDVYLLSDIIDFVKEQYDFIIIDNSPSRNILLTMALVAADGVVIPTECDDGALDGIMAIENDIKKYRDGRMKISHAHVWGLILTKSEKTLMHDMAKENLEEIAQEIGGEPFIIGIRKSIGASACKKLLQPLQQYEKYNNAAVDYRAVAKELMIKAGGEN